VVPQNVFFLSSDMHRDFQNLFLNFFNDLVFWYIPSSELCLVASLAGGRGALALPFPFQANKCVLYAKIGKKLV